MGFPHGGDEEGGNGSTAKDVLTLVMVVLFGALFIGVVSFVCIMAVAG